MRKATSSLSLIITLLALTACSQSESQPSKLDDASPPVLSAGVFQKPRPKIYDESADGAEQIADALETAKAENKRVLLQFGANWCGWCHKLHHLFEGDEKIAARLKESYVVVLIDVNGKHNQEVDAKYGHPMQHGLPVIVILDAVGKQLTTKNTAELEVDDHHDPEKVLAFLDEWA
jgi:thioredoxin-related protein